MMVVVIMMMQVARKKVEALESMPTGKGLGIPAGKRLRAEEAPLPVRKKQDIYYYYYLFKHFEMYFTSFLKRPKARQANAVKAGPPAKKAKIHSPEEVITSSASSSSNWPISVFFFGYSLASGRPSDSLRCSFYLPGWKEAGA